MHCFIDEVEVPAGVIAVADLNYGQHWRWEGRRRCLYRYRIPLGEFRDRVGAEFDKAMREIADDLANFPQDWDEPFFSRMAELGFPALDVLLERHRGLLLAILQWLDNSVLDWLYQPPLPTDVIYSANSLDRIVFDNEVMVLEGIAYPCPVQR